MSVLAAANESLATSNETLTDAQKKLVDNHIEKDNRHQAERKQDKCYTHTLLLF